MINRYSSIVPVLLISCIFVLCGTKGVYPAKPGMGSAAILVKKIYDGDTIGVLIAGQFQKVRLIGIDAPEMDQRPWGGKARDCLEALIRATASKVSLEYDLEQKDKYGRLLAYVRTQDGKIINEEMLRKGCAVLFTLPPNVKYAGRLQAAQCKARDLKAGIWGEHGLQERPYDFRKEHPR